MISIPNSISAALSVGNLKVGQSFEFSITHWEAYIEVNGTKYDRMPFETYKPNDFGSLKITDIEKCDSCGFFGVEDIKISLNGTIGSASIINRSISISTGMTIFISAATSIQNIPHFEPETERFREPSISIEQSNPPPIFAIGDIKFYDELADGLQDLSDYYDPNTFNEGWDLKQSQQTYSWDGSEIFAAETVLEGESAGMTESGENWGVRELAATKIKIDVHRNFFAEFYVKQEYEYHIGSGSFFLSTELGWSNDQTESNNSFLNISNLESTLVGGMMVSLILVMNLRKKK